MNTAVLITFALLMALLAGVGDHFFLSDWWDNRWNRWIDRLRRRR